MASADTTPTFATGAEGGSDGSRAIAAQGGGTAGAEPPQIRRVLVVAPHPDDETLTSGALLATLASRCEVTVVTCTRGERGEMIGADLAHLLKDARELAGYRVGELERALTALGISDHAFLDTIDGGARLVDSGMRWDEGAQHVRALPALDAGPDAFSKVASNRVISALTSVVDRVRPDLVLTDEPGGGYGHPDHRRAHEITMEAVAAAQHRPAFVAWMTRPASAQHAAQQWLAARTDLPAAGVDGAALILPDPNGPQPSIVIPDTEVDLEVDVSAHLPALLGAMQAHRSQVQVPSLALDSGPGAAASGWFALSNGLLQPIFNRAWLRLAPGWGEPAALRGAIGAVLSRDEQPMEGGRWYRPTMTVFSFVLGVMVAAVGTAFHRANPPWGLVVALVALAAGGLLARTFVDRAGHMAFGSAAVLMVLAMTYVRPGGDVLVTGEPLGLAWLIGAILAALLVPAVVPRRWFADS